MSNMKVMKSVMNILNIRFKVIRLIESIKNQK